MKFATIRTVCECQARLEADLDEHRLVLQGRAIDKRGHVRFAPAQALRAARRSFDVAWQCPFCTRNQLRAFDAGGLVYRAVTSVDAASPTEA
jgi:hypothetical protein